MKSRIRYTQEEKAVMKQKALALLEQGKSQKFVAKELRTTVSTLHAVLDGETYPGRRKKTAVPAVALPNLDPESPVLQLAAKRQRLLDIAAMREDLDKEEHRLKEEMKSLYDRLGREIFGNDLHQE